jgi:DNA-binding transcriptional ArsR family regulator
LLQDSPRVLLSDMTKYDPDLSLIFQALSDPTRRAMLARLGLGAVPVSELARPTGLALPTVMRHLAVLEEAALIATEKNGRVRMCRARPETMAATADWLADQRAIWEARTDRLEDYVLNMMKENPK